MNTKTFEELITTNKMYEFVTERFDSSGIERTLGNGRIELNQELIALILDLYDNDVDGDFFSQKLRRFSLEDIIHYIQASHRYYLQKKIPEIEQSLLHIFSKYGSTHQLLASLALFFNEYKNRLVNHFKMEEKYFLPYIKKLSHAATASDEELFEILSFNSTAEFSKQHDDVEEGLKEVTNIIQQHSEETIPLPYRIFINQVELFELELRKHAIIEDHVLVPMVMELEQTLRKRLEHS